MFNFLFKKIFDKYGNSTPASREKAIILTGYIGLGINFSLFIMKFIFGFLINSISIIGDSLNNLSDSLTSVITIFGSKISSKPADTDHPYGHGRSEYVATLAVGISVFIVGIQLLKSSIESIIYPREIGFSRIVMLMLLMSIVLKIYMYLYNMKLHKIIVSPLNRATAIDSRNDILATSIVLASSLIYYYFNLNIDGVAGIFLSVMVIRSGVEIFKDMGDVLLGKEVGEETIEKIREIMMEGAFVRGVHAIEIHDYGQGNMFGTAHLEIPINIDAFTIHEVIDVLELKVKKELNIVLSIHLDPVYCLEEDMFIRYNCRNYKSNNKNKIDSN